MGWGDSVYPINKIRLLGFHSQGFFLSEDY